MSDRFKFRAWDKMTNKYIDSGISFNNSTMSIESIDVLEIEQCTGLKDKNGKLIYEGDIVKCDSDYAPRKVIYEPLWMQFVLERHGMDHIVTGNDGSWYDEIKVIGNIHENGDLLQ